MSESQEAHQFSTINTKLAAPTKKSLFERQKAEAEAKRQREKAETAAVYEDFVKSFDNVDEGQTFQGSSSRSGTGTSMGTAAGLGGPPRRHFTNPPTGPAAGRGGIASGIVSGSRGGLPLSGPGSLGPVASLTRKRTHDGGPPMRAESDYGTLANDSNDKEKPMAAFQASDDEEEDEESKSERAAPKPTMHLSSLPPSISPKIIKALIPSNLTVDAIKMLPSSGPGSAGAERKSSSAIVTLAKDTPANDVDAAVNSLQNKYLGFGYYLNLSRHLSSAALSAGVPVTAGISSALTAMPFGAKPRPSGPSGSMNRGPPPQSIHRGGFAPPASYYGSASGQYGGSAPLQVTVTPPSDLKQLKLIHKTLEAVLTHGPEFETLLMGRAHVQQDEKWAWIWDSRSEGGVWYRWRLWEILSGLEARNSQADGSNRTSSKQIFDNGIIWETPSKPLRFQYATQFEELVSASDYDSSEDDESGDEGQTRHHHNRDGPNLTDINAIGEGKSYLNPFKKTKLTHLLARLPDTIGRLRKGDVARVTAFAIQHAGQGADEVVDMVVSNIEKPYSFTTANTERLQKRGSNDDADEDEEKPPTKDREDQSAAMLVALYVVSDILSSSSTSGVRHAWKYRQLFESSLKARNIFETLGRLDKTLHWGRLRAEKWKRSIGSVLSLWEGWCVFPQSSHEHFVDRFMNPPPTPAEIAAAEAQKDLAAANTTKSKWKAVDDAARKPSRDISPLIEEEEQVGLDGDPMDEDMDDLDGEPMEDVDGESMDSDDDRSPQGHMDSNHLQDHKHEGVAGAPGAEDDTVPDTNGRGEAKVNPFAISRMKRPKAEDMFADSDGD